MKTLALSVRAHSIESALCDEQGRLSDYRESPWTCDNGIAYLVEYLKPIVDWYTGYHAIGVTVRNLRCTGDSVRLFHKSLPGLNILPLKAILEEYTHLPVTVTTFIAALSMAEHTYGPSKAFKQVLYLHIGTGIDGALLLNDTIHSGYRSIAGALGHALLYPEGLKCHCGQYGCFEQYASTTALVRRGKALDARIETGKDLFAALDNGNFALRKVVDDWTTDLIYGLSSAVHVLNPDAIVLCGGIMREDYIYNFFRRNFYNHLVPYYRDLQIMRQSLERKSSLQGVTLLANQTNR